MKAMLQRAPGSAAAVIAQFIADTFEAKYLSGSP
jgi:hypothetical protein